MWRIVLILIFIPLSRESISSCSTIINSVCSLVSLSQENIEYFQVFVVEQIFSHLRSVCCHHGLFEHRIQVFSIPHKFPGFCKYYPQGNFRINLLLWWQALGLAVLGCGVWVLVDQPSFMNVIDEADKVCKEQSGGNVNCDGKVFIERLVSDQYLARFEVRNRALLFSSLHLDCLLRHRGPH